MALQLRRGTAQERLLSGVVLAVGELLWTYDDEFLYIGDGVTPGGNLVNNKIGSYEVEGTFLNLYGIDSYYRSGGFAYYNTSVEHTLVGGEEIEVAALSDSSFNGIFTVQVSGTGPTTIRVANAGPDTSLQTDSGTWKSTGSAFVDQSAIVWDEVKNKFVVRLLDKTDVGLDQVDNTSDINKPVSTAQQAAIDSAVAAQNLGDHADVNLAGVSNGQALVYDSTAGEWINGDVASGGGGGGVSVPADRLYAPDTIAFTSTGKTVGTADVWNFRYSVSRPIRAYEWTPQRIESMVFENYTGYLVLNGGDQQYCDLNPAPVAGDWTLSNNPSTGTGVSYAYVIEPTSRINTDYTFNEWVQLNDGIQFGCYASWETNDGIVKYDDDASLSFKPVQSVTCDYVKVQLPVSYSLFGTGRTGPVEGDGTSFLTLDEVHFRSNNAYSENNLPKMVGKATSGGSYANIAQAEADGWTVVQFSNFNGYLARYYPTTNPTGDLPVSVPFPIDLYGYSIGSFVFSTTGGILFLPAGQTAYQYPTGESDQFKNIDERWADATNQLYFCFNEVGRRGSAQQCMWKVTGNAVDGNRTLVIRWQQRCSGYELIRPVELSIAEKDFVNVNRWAAVMGPWYTSNDTTGTASSGEWIEVNNRYFNYEYNSASVVYDATLRGPAVDNLTGEVTTNGSFDTSPFAENEWGKGFVVLPAQSATGGYDTYFAFDFNKIEQIEVDDATDGQVLTYDNATGTWQPVTPVTTVETLGDVVLTSLASGEVLQYDGANWVNAPAGGGGGGALGDLTDVTITAAAAGEVLRYNGSAWVDAQLDYSDLSGTPAIPADIGDLGDVTITSAAAGEVLRYNGSTWVDAQLDYSDLTGTPALVSAINDLSDVTITAAAAGEVLRYNGSVWVDAQLAYTDLSGTPTNVSSFTNDAGYLVDITAEPIGDLSNVSLTSVTTGDVLSYNGSSWVNSAAPPADISGSSINALNDVDTTTSPPSNGEGLIWNSISGNWEPGTVSAGSVALDDLTDVTITAAATGEVLRYNGSAWVDAQLAYSDLSGTPSLAPVATSGDYNDLSNKPTIPVDINDLGDVTITSATTGQILEYNGSAWVNVANSGGGGPIAIDDLTDVDTATNPPATGQVLKWDGANWVPGTDISGGGSATLGRGDGGDVDALTVDSAFVFGVYGGGDVDTTTQDDPIEFVTYDVDGGEIA